MLKWTKETDEERVARRERGNTIDTAFVDGRRRSSTNNTLTPFERVSFHSRQDIRAYLPMMKTKIEKAIEALELSEVTTSPGIGLGALLAGQCFATFKEIADLFVLCNTSTDNEFYRNCMLIIHNIHVGIDEQWMHSAVDRQNIKRYAYKMLEELPGSSLWLTTNRGSDARAQLHHIQQFGAIPTADRGPADQPPGYYNELFPYLNEIQKISDTYVLHRMKFDCVTTLVVIFYSVNNKECRQFCPKFQQMMEQMPNWLESEGNQAEKYPRVLRVDVDEASDIAMEAGIKHLPTVHFYRDTQLMEVVEGPIYDAIIAALQKCHMYNRKYGCRMPDISLPFPVTRSPRKKF